MLRKWTCRAACIGAWSVTVVMVLALCGCGANEGAETAPAVDRLGFREPDALVAWLRSLPQDGSTPSPADEERLLELCHAETDGQRRYLEEQFDLRAPINRGYDAINHAFALGRAPQGSVTGYPYAGCWRLAESALDLDSAGRARVALEPSPGVRAGAELHLVRIDEAWRISGYTFEHGVDGYDGAHSPVYAALPHRASVRGRILDFVARLERGAFTDAETARLAFRALITE